MQEGAVRSLYEGQGWVEWGTLEGLEVREGRQWMARRYPRGTPVEGGYVSEGVMGALVEGVEEARAAEGWVAVAPLVPSGLGPRDVEGVCREAVRLINAGRGVGEGEGMVQVGEGFAVAKALLVGLKGRLLRVVEKLAVDVWMEAQAKQVQVQQQRGAPSAQQQQQQRREDSDGAGSEDEGGDTFDGDAQRSRGPATTKEEQNRLKREERKRKRVEKAAAVKEQQSQGKGRASPKGALGQGGGGGGKAFTRAVLQRLVKEKWKGEDPPAELVAAVSALLYPDLLPVFTASYDRASAAPITEPLPRRGGGCDEGGGGAGSEGSA